MLRTHGAGSRPNHQSTTKSSLQHGIILTTFLFIYYFLQFIPVHVTFFLSPCTLPQGMAPNYNSHSSGELSTHPISPAFHLVPFKHTSAQQLSASMNHFFVSTDNMYLSTFSLFFPLYRLHFYFYCIHMLSSL